jgi:hypothetical protein
MPAQGKLPKTGRPAAQFSGGRYAPKQWGQEVLMDLECPSGQRCQVRRPGITGLVKAGVLDSIDSLSAIVKTEHIDRVEQGKDPHVSQQEIAELARNKDGLLKAVDLAAKVTVHVVTQPKLTAVPLVLNPVTGEPELDDDLRPIEMPIEDRPKTRFDPETNEPVQIIYVDQVDLMDQMFILQFVVGGVTDLESFRSGIAEAVGGLEGGTEVPLPAE